MSNKVFVVRGRNEPARKAVFDLLRALGLSPLEWAAALRESATGPSTFIDDIVQSAMEGAAAILVVCTGDDEFRLRPELGGESGVSYQPRGNVLYEAGLAFSRAAKRTILVTVGDVALPSDFSGWWTIRLPSLPTARNMVEFRNALRDALEQVGCRCAPGLDWLDAGDLLGAIVPTDYKTQLLRRYDEHVNWWIRGRPIEPNARGRTMYTAIFGDAPVWAYMKPIEHLIICSASSNAFEVLQQIRERLLDYREVSLPVAMVLDGACRPVGIVTPSDLKAKFDIWFRDRAATIADEIWFRNPRTCFDDETCREAYRKMLTLEPAILTGLPVVSRQSGELVGFLPHHGGREDWKKDD